MPSNDILQPVWIVACAGHRPAQGPGRSEEALLGCEESIRAALEALQAKANQCGGRIELLTSAASGTDQLVSKIARDLDLSVHLILPMPEESFAQDFKGSEGTAWKCTSTLIDSAKAGERNGSFRVAEGDNARPACYHEMNLQMLESADAVLVVWNGAPAGGVGGTAEFVEEATRLDLPVAVINPVQPQTTHFDHSWSNWPPPCEMLNTINSDLTRHVTPSQWDTRRGQGPAWSVFERLNGVANAAGDHFRRRLIRSLVLHFVAALLAAMNTAFSPALELRSAQLGHGLASELLHYTPKILTGIEFVLVFMAWILMHQATRRHTHGIWRRTRFATELSHGLIMSAGLIDPLRPMVARHDLAWRRFALSSGLLASRHLPVMSIEDRKNAYATGRIRDQAEHFRKKLPHAGAQKVQLERLATIATILAPIVIGLAFVLKLGFAEQVKMSFWGGTVISFLPVALPLLAGASTSLLVALDAGRRTERYSQLADRLERLLKSIPGIKTHGGLKRIAEQTEEALLYELVEWQAASKNMGH